MKKFLVAILAILYISSSTGAPVHMHYCMGKLAGAGLGNHTSKTCGNCGMEKSGKKTDDCCKDENKFFKSQTDQQTSQPVFQLPQPVTVALPVSCFEMPSVDIFFLLTENLISHAPPQGSGVAVYIRNCFFLI